MKSSGSEPNVVRVTQEYMNLNIDIMSSFISIFIFN